MDVKAWLRARVQSVRSLELRVVLSLLAVGLLAIVFLKIGEEVSEGATARLDRAILLAFRNSPSDPIGSFAIQAAVINLSALGSAAVMILIVIIASLYFALSGNGRYGLLLMGCATGTFIGMYLLKGFYERARPSVVTHLTENNDLSFPSGHSMISAAVYLTLSVVIARALPTRRLRVFSVATGAFLTMLIGLSRIYLGVHYPTDVLAGWTAGAAWALCCGLILRALVRRDVEGVPEAAPTDKPAKP